MANPDIEYRTIIEDSGDPGYVNRLLIGTAVTGLVRVEWVGARYGQIIPTNWSMVTMQQYVNAYMPLRYQVADAQNLIVRELVLRDFEWLFLLEHDVMLPPDGFIQLNEYIRRADTPIVSGLYFTRSSPSEPILYRGRGTSFYDKWRLGDLVWCDGVPTGCLLIHRSILEICWNEAKEYMIGSQAVRRVFDTPRKQWVSPDSDEFHMTTGTSDLDWCTQIMEGDVIRRAGWHDYWEGLEDERWPFLVDTRLFCKHIEMDGRQFPTEPEIVYWKGGE